MSHIIIIAVLVGASHRTSDEIPLRVANVVFFCSVFSAAFSGVSVAHTEGRKHWKNGGILQKHAYLQSSPAVIIYFTCGHISLSYGHFWSKKYSKIFSVSPNAVKKSPIGLIFCRNMLIDSLQGQLKNSLVEVIFH